MRPPDSPLALKNSNGGMGFISNMGGSYKESAFSSISQEAICQGWSCSTKD